MATLASLINIARIRTRTKTTRSNLISDADLVVLANEALEDCRKKMIEVESNLVYGHTSITTVDGTIEYSLPDGIIAPFVAPVTVASVHGLMTDGVWIDGEDWFLSETVEEEKIKYDIANSTSQPQKYYLTQDWKIGFLPVPDDEYTVYMQYWKPQATIASGDSMPWKDIWNQYITKRLEYEINSIFERDISRIAMELDSLDAIAMQTVFSFGVRHRKLNTDFFSVDGI